MVVGSGDIATALKELPDNPAIIYFASGVSNSRETRENEFNREAKLLISQNKERHLVYFSSLSIYFTESVYTAHKLFMEEIVRQYFPSYTIIRIGNITWGSNPNTFINYLKAHPEIKPDNVYRNLIDKEDFLYWCSLASETIKELNLIGKRVWVPDYIKEVRDGNNQ